MTNIKELAIKHIEKIKKEMEYNKKTYNSNIEDYTVYSSIEKWPDEGTCRYITTIENDNGDVLENLVATIQNDIDVLYQFDTQLRELVQNETELMGIWEQANLETPVYNC